MVGPKFAACGIQGFGRRFCPERRFQEICGRQNGWRRVLRFEEVDDRFAFRRDLLAQSIKGVLAFKPDRIAIAARDTAPDVAFVLVEFEAGFDPGFGKLGLPSGGDGGPVLVTSFSR